MERHTVAAIAGIVSSMIIVGSASAETCPWQQPDPTDEIGASRTQTPSKVLEAIGLVRNGQVYPLAHPYDELTIPLPFGRTLDVTINNINIDQTGPSQTFNVGFVSADLGQIGTQFDALGHAGHDLGLYNCIAQSEIGPDANGLLTKLDVVSVKPFFTRGILLDFINHSTVPKVFFDGAMLVEDSYVITVEDVEQVLANQGVDQPREGDVVLFYTGWDSLFGVDNERLAFGPGPGVDVARWLAARKVAMVGADTQAVEAIEGGASVELLADPDLLGQELGPFFNAVHFILLTENGIHLLENMRLHDLAAGLLDALTSERDPFGKGFQLGAGSPYEFLFTYAPVPIKGLAGSPGQPLAIR